MKKNNIPKSSKAVLKQYKDDLRSMEKSNRCGKKYRKLKKEYEDFEDLVTAIWKRKRNK